MAWAVRYFLFGYSFFSSVRVGLAFAKFIILEYSFSFFSFVCVYLFVVDGFNVA